MSNHSEEDLLSMFQQAIKIEEETLGPEYIEKYGSQIINHVTAVSLNLLDLTSISSKLVASVFRRLITTSTTMEFTADEIKYWNFIQLLHGEAVIRYIFLSLACVAFCR